MSAPADKCCGQCHYADWNVLQDRVTHRGKPVRQLLQWGACSHPDIADSWKLINQRPSILHDFGTNCAKFTQKHTPATE